MLSNLTPYSWKNITPEAIEDIYDHLSRKSFNGDPETNGQLKMLLKNPKNEAFETAVLNNLEGVGVKELLMAMKKPGMESFATKVYRKIQRMDLETDAERALSEGEITKEEFDAMKSDKQELNVVQEKIVEGDFEYISGAKLRKARKIKNFKQDLEVNQKLFTIAKEFVA